ncbi:hypothetical protein GJ744_002493 [Endocarpon pusillum]|uniref:Methyltransferase type 11 domain-containing protein n=1 Tax=Endocarpon pusillum TaxID=364733 RepID=A0A8H7AB70_9EURO|nr:hypothetical protein GJ744_002493 [Endocarpon pusillum]
MSRTTISEAALNGFAASSSYDKHRPSYPADAVDQLLCALKVAAVQGARVADLAAGTGKFTELLAARPEQYSTVAIEPHEDMKAELERKSLKGVKVVMGTADDMSEIADASFDALIASQSFHWFANRPALEEIHRVLKPTRLLGMIWNIEDYNAPRDWDMTTSWESQIRDLTWTLDDGLPRFRHEKWRECFDDQLASTSLSLAFADPLFSLPLGEGSVKFETWLNKDDIWKRYKTLSQIAVLGKEKLEEVKKEFFNAIDHKDVVQDGQGRVAVHGHTFFAWTSSIPEQPLRNGG